VNIATDDAPARRKPGRPRAAVPHINLSSWVPVPVYDQLAQAADRRNESLSELACKVLTASLKRSP
jgi:hypothetical protein